MANQYHVGTLVRVTGTFTDSGGSAVDPTTVTFKYRTPEGVTTTYVYTTDAELVKSSTGVYYVDVSVTSSGVWWHEFSSTGTGQAASEAYFEAKESHV